MLRKDDKKFAELLINFPAQILMSKDIVQGTKLSPLKFEAKNIYFCGMGGSAIAGDILSDLYIDQIDVPFFVQRGYHLPKCIHEDSLVIISSYSGNTEETISILKEAKAHKAHIIAITSGGKIAKEMKNKDTIIIPTGYPPRQAFGLSFFSLLYVLDKLKILTVNEDDISETIHILEKLAQHNNPNIHDHVHFTQTFAQSLLHKVPVFYAADRIYGSLATRWRNQINENSKTLAFSNTFPELNHNEIVGYDMNPDLMKNFIFVFLRDPEREEKQIQKRIELTKKILNDRNTQIMEVFPEGNSRLARAFSLLYRGDWVSFYLAQLNEKNPFEINNIDFLKEGLSK